MATLVSPSLGKLISNVRNMLNQPNPANSFWTDAELTEYLNEAVRVYFAEMTKNNEGLFTTTSDLNIVADAETIALPSDCFVVKALYKKRAPNYYDMLDYRNNLTDGYSTQGGTSPSSYYPTYYFRGNNIVLHPVPNFSETAGLKLEYLQFPDMLRDAGDTLTAQVSPIFKQLIESYAVWMAKHKESLVSGTDLTSIPERRLSSLYTQFKETIAQRSKNPTFIKPFNPELE